MTVPRLQSGQLLRIAEANYMYGAGVLTLRVTAVDPNPHPNVEWLRVIGVEVRWDGSDGDQRNVLVRVRAIPSCFTKINLDDLGPRQD